MTDDAGSIHCRRPQRGHALHHGHGADRHDVDRADRAGAARAGRDLHVDAERAELVLRRGRVRLQLRQLPGVAGDRRPVRPLRPPAGPAGRFLRPRYQLHRHRARDGTVDADRGPTLQRRDAVEPVRRQRLRRRHHATGRPGTTLRPARRGVRCRLHPRAHARRPARRARRPPAVLRGRRPGHGQPRVRLFRAARIAAGGSAPGCRLAHCGQPVRVAGLPRPALRHRPAGRDDRLHGARAVHPLHELGAAQPAQVRLGAARERLVPLRGRRHVGAGAGSPAGQAAEALLGAAPGHDRPGLVEPGLPRLGPGQRRLDDLRRHRRQRPRLHRRRDLAEHRLGRRRRRRGKARRWAR